MLHAVSEPLLCLFNGMLEEGIFPNVLKVIKVTSILKGDKLNLFSYRPISFVLISSKVFEYRVVNNSLLCRYFLQKVFFVNVNIMGLYQVKIQLNMAVVDVSIL